MMEGVEESLWIVILIVKLDVVTIVDIFTEELLTVRRWEVSRNAGKMATWSVGWTNYSGGTTADKTRLGCPLKSTAA